MNESVIMCVDDEDIVLRSLKRELNDAFHDQYVIETAEGGEEALEVFEDLLEDQYDVPLVISDYIMPDLKGDELLKRIHVIAPQTRKVMLTGQASMEGIGNAVNYANLYRFINKPWNQQDLILTVTEAVRSYFQDKEIDQQNQELERLNQELLAYNKTLAQKVDERTQELHATLKKVEEANSKILESLQYAKIIQRSLLPNLEQIKTRLPDSFFLWIPRDIVGGDMFFTEFFDEEFIVSVLDCTGHGVPGAFMTMIASSGLRQIINNDGCRDPAEILRRLNFTVKTSLHQHTEYALSDDGLDAAICLLKPHAQTMVFAGANLPLYYIQHAELHVIKGDRHSIGYKRSDLDFRFTNHIVTIEKGMSAYLSTDGFIDQLGGKESRRFGSRQFQDVLLTCKDEAFDRQREILLHAFETYRGNHERLDDITIVGFRML